MIWQKVLFRIVQPPPGKPGKDGESAYELAKAQNPDIGSEEEWRASLNGTNGEDGKEIKNLTLEVDASGKITGGDVHFTDETTAPINVVQAVIANVLTTDEDDPILTDDDEEIIAIKIL